MEKCCLVFLAFWVFPFLSARSADISLAWIPQAGSEPVGYKVHWGRASRSYDSVEDVGNVTAVMISGFDQAYTYFLAVTLYEADGAESDYSAELVWDNIPPSIPRLLGGQAVPGGVILTWGASIDDAGRIAYEVYRNGQSVGIVRQTTFTDSGLIPLSPYTYTVEAIDDVSCNRSASSTAVTVMTPPLNSEVILDNNSQQWVTVAGSWIPGTVTPGFIGNDYLHDGNTEKGTKYIEYRPDLPQTAFYEVFINYTEGANRASNTPVDIIHATATTTHLLDQRTGGGAWLSLGVYIFQEGTSGGVVIRTDGTDGYVIADAVRFVWRVCVRPNRIDNIRVISTVEVTVCELRAIPSSDLLEIDMTRICDKCHRVHRGTCPKPPTLAQLRRETDVFLRKLDAAHKAAKNSKLRFGISNGSGEGLTDAR